MLSTVVTGQLLVDGVVQGMVYGLLAMSLVLVYRSNQVINFAVGNMGLVGAGLLVICNVNYGIPFWISVAIALVVGTLYGAVVELAVVRRLFRAPRVIVLVATIGVAQLSLAIVTAYPHLFGPTARAAAAHPARGPGDRAGAGMVPQPHHVGLGGQRGSRQP
jgi:branched-subunit amino acid ABC-type transport system permease component